MLLVKESVEFAMRLIGAQDSLYMGTRGEAQNNSTELEAMSSCQELERPRVEELHAPFIGC